MLRLIPAAAAALVLALAAPAMGQQFSDADRAAVSARLDAVHDQVVAGDMSAAMDVLPPGIIEGIAARYGVTPQQAREAGREAAAAAMDQVEIVEYRIDMDAAEVRLTPDGRRTYVIVPLHMTMRIQNITARALSPVTASRPSASISASGRMP